MCGLRRLLPLTLLVGLLAVTGCEKKQAGLVRVEGVVVLDGKPLSDIYVQFVPDALGANTVGPTSTATTDQNGRFVLKAAEKEGAVPGTHLVVLEDTTREPPEQGAQFDASPGRIHINYMQASTTPLKLEIPTEGTSELKVELMRNPPEGVRPMRQK